MRVDVVDPSAFAPPYDHELSAALARAGADVSLVTSEFAYGPVPEPAGYRLDRRFYTRTPRGASGRLRLAAKLAQHVPDMLAYRRTSRDADVVHFQWLPVEAVDNALLPAAAPVVLTAHEVLPRGRRLGQAWGRRRLYDRVDAVVVHTDGAAHRLTTELGVAPDKVHVVRHGVFGYLCDQPDERPLPPDLAAVDKPVVLHLGVWRPYHGIDVLLEAWRGIHDAELWIVGLPKIPVEPLRAQAPPGVRFLPRFVTDPELPAFFRRADVMVMPYRRIEASGVLFSALPFGVPILASAVGSFVDVAAVGGAETVPPGDAGALHDALVRLIGDAGRRAQLREGALRASAGPFSWDAVAARTLAVYRTVLERSG